jgi:hypothetical protein
MSDIRFQIAVGAYVFIGAMGLAFGMMLSAVLLCEVRRWQLKRLASCDTHPKGGDVQQAPLVSGAVPNEDSGDAR